MNAGFTWSPGNSVELGVDYWSFDYTDVIIQQNPQALLDAAAAGDPAAALQIVRGATGGLVRVNSFYDNASSLKTDGFDLSAVYASNVPAGSFRVGAQATLVNSYRLVDPASGPDRRRRQAQLRELRHVGAGDAGQPVPELETGRPRRQRLRPISSTPILTTRVDPTR